MKNKCLVWILFGLMGMPLVAMASGVPVHSGAEATTQAVDAGRSGVLDDLVKLQDKMVDTMTNSIGGRETFGLKSLQSNLSGALTTASETVTDSAKGLENLIGKGAEQGKIAISAAGEHVAPMKERIKETIAVPATASEKIQKTTDELMKINAERAKTLENTATSALAKSWVLQSEAANTAASVSNTRDELPNAESQQSIMGTILRLQEETQKNLNTRLSVMAEDLKLTSLTALDNGL